MKPTIRELLERTIRNANYTDGRAASLDLAVRVEAVLKLHEPLTYGDDQACCFECHTMSPCPTIRALDGEQ